MKRKISGCAVSVLLVLLLFLWGCAAPGRDAVPDMDEEDFPGTAEILDGEEGSEPDLSGRKEYVWGGNVYLPPKEEEVYTLEEVLFEMLAQTDTESNLLVSPYSMRCVLTGLYHTAEDGEAKAELAAFLGYDGSDETVYEEQGALRQEILKGRKGIELSLADSLWVRQEFEGRPIAGQAEEVAKALREHYGSELFSVKDFGAETVRRMNGWAEEATEGMIRNVFDSLDEQTILVLMNALYFNGTWQTVFEPKDTAERPFYGCAAGKEGNPVPFMALWDESFLYWKGNGYEALELPYGKDGEIVMDVIMAEGQKDMSYHALFSSGGEELKKVLAGLDEADPSEITCLRLPKWEEGHTINGLIDVFQAAGLEKIFQSGDWSRISDWVEVTSILQKTAIEVTEHGTKAAAVSAVAATGAAMPVEEKNFIVDHNFSYVIREKATGTLLFVGLINQLS